MTVLTLLLLAMTQPAFAADAKPSVPIRVLVAENRTYLDLTVKGDVTLRALPSGQRIQTKGRLDKVRLVPTKTGFKLYSRFYVQRSKTNY